jgi:hypothetical protein
LVAGQKEKKGREGWAGWRKEKEREREKGFPFFF